MKAKHAALVVLLAAGWAGASVAADKAEEKRTVERGRYLVHISGCNDCHTHGYPQTDGKTAEADWLTGSDVGFQGPWGTTYPANLRLKLQEYSEEAWIKRARAAMRPPMPWFNLAAMSDADLRAVYRYVRSLGPKGKPAPDYAAPGQPVRTPYIVFVPQNLPSKTAAK
jgi:mono/diheme cytochrome c family protein